MASDGRAGTALVLRRQAADMNAFLARLTRAQTLFLDALADARRTLDSGREPGGDQQLARAAAMHGRLAQQFLDAQRALLRLRADADRLVEEITEATELEVVSMLETIEPLAATTSGGDVAWHEPRTPASPGEVAMIGEAIEAVQLDEPSWETAERQLRELLEAWWRAESQEVKAVVDDAQARSAMRLHLARLDAGAAQIETPSAELPPPTGATSSIRQVAAIERPSCSAVGVIEAIDVAGAGVGLDALLTSLLELVEPSQDETSAFVPGSDTSVVLTWPAPAGDELRFVLADPAAEGEDAFDRFWGQRPHRRSNRSTREWILRDVLFPITSVVGALVLVLAWIG